MIINTLHRHNTDVPSRVITYGRKIEVGILRRLGYRSACLVTTQKMYD